MCSLATFQPPPPEGYVTVCERNGELISGRDMQAHLDTYSKSLDSRSAHVKESARSAFLEHDDTLRQKLLRAWYEHGFAGIAETIASMDEKEKGGAWLPGVASRVLAAIRWTNALHGSLFPHLTMSGEELIMEFSSNRDWRESVVRCLAWHPHTAKYAVALKDDSIRVHTDRKHDIVPILKHKLQRAVADIAWRPVSASVLAVACQSCILIWNVDPTSLATRPSTSSVQVLSQSGHSPVTSIAWYPQGGILVSGSPTDTAIMVWDVAMETCVPLRRVGGGGVSLLRWSPDGSKLLSACPSPMFRVWECQWWTCEKWTKLFSRCMSACWSPDGSTLLFATADEPKIYSLCFHQLDDERRPFVGGSKVAVSCVDLSVVEIETDAGAIRVGGTVQALAWDPTGERLAVQFKGQASGLVALFQTRLQPILEVIPCGFVRGEMGAIPNLISFQNSYRQGALLTVVWSTGKIAFVPLHFLPRDAVERHQVSLEGNGNGHVTMPGLYSGE